MRPTFSSLSPSRLVGVIFQITGERFEGVRVLSSRSRPTDSSTKFPLPDNTNVGGLPPSSLTSVLRSHVEQKKRRGINNHHISFRSLNVIAVQSVARDRARNPLHVCLRIRGAMGWPGQYGHRLLLLAPASGRLLEIARHESAHDSPIPSWIEDRAQQNESLVRIRRSTGRETPCLQGDRLD